MSTEKEKKNFLAHLRKALSSIKKNLNFAMYTSPDGTTLEFPSNEPKVGDEVIAYDATGNQVKPADGDYQVRVGEKLLSVTIKDGVVADVKEVQLEQTQQQSQQAQPQQIQQSANQGEELAKKVNNLEQVINKLNEKISSIEMSAQKNVSELIKVNEQILKAVELSAPQTTKKDEGSEDWKANLRKQLYGF